MGLKSYRPLTPTLRYKQIGDRKEITADKYPRRRPES